MKSDSLVTIYIISAIAGLVVGAVLNDILIGIAGMAIVGMIMIFRIPRPNRRREE